MCHSTGLKQQSEQIEKFVENGMPQKVIKNVNFIINRKKREENLKNRNKDETENNLNKIKHETAKISTTSTTSSSLPTTTTVTYLTCPFTANKAIISTKNLTNNINNQQQPQQKDNNRKQISNLNSTATSSTIEKQFTEDVDKIEVYVDALTVGTQWTKKFAEHLNCTIQKLQSSKLYTVLTRTTQPAHLIAFLTISLVLLIVGPDLIEYSSTNNSSKNVQIVEAQANEKNGHNVLPTVFYLGAFATHFGAQIWMTFVSGLALYFSLPRHTFGQCQQILFPKYFALNGILSIGMLVVYIKYFLNSWTLMDVLQIVGLALSAFIEVTVRLYLAPPMLRLMLEKYKIEDTVGSGNEIGNIVQGDLVQCPHYQRIHKMFRRIHMTIAIGNMTVLMCTCLNLYFLASKIKLS